MERSDDRQRVFMAVREGIKEIRVGTVSIRAIMGGLEERTPDVRGWTKRSAGRAHERALALSGILDGDLSLTLPQRGSVPKALPATFVGRATKFDLPVALGSRLPEIESSMVS
jgi:hypothetical protein